MSNPFVAEIRIYPFNFAPKGWAFCDGQIMPISQNTALFSLLGTTYGGDGKATFALPDLQGSSPLQPGQGSGLSWRDLGEVGGRENVTLLAAEMPFHSHTVGSGGAADTAAPAGAAWAAATAATNQPLYGDPAGPTTAGLLFDKSGSDLPHNNMQPYLTLNFCIALQGVYPSRW